MSYPSIRTVPRPGSYSRGTRWVIVVLPAPEGPTSAVIRPAGARKLTSLRTHVSPARSGMGRATDSSEARDTSLAAGYRNDTPSNSIAGAIPFPERPAGRAAAFGRPALSGVGGRTPKRRAA